MQRRTQERVSTPRIARVPIAVAGTIALTIATPLGATAAHATAGTGSFGPRATQHSLEGEAAHRVTAAASGQLLKAGAAGARIASPRPAAVPPRTTAHPRGGGAVTSGDSVEVQEGDTVSAIAQRHGLRTEDVLRLNGLEWSSIIRPGQVLRLVATPAPAPAATSERHYAVVAGDTMIAIARAHGVSLQALLDANGLSRSSIIYPGQSIVVPGAATTATAAPAPSPAAAPAPAAAPGGYTVRAGDTVSAIAAAHGTSVQAVLDANGLGWSSIIYPGQVLALPGFPAPAAAPAPTPAAAPGLDAEQIENARLIIRIGRELGVSDRGIAIALGTAMQESWIRNLDWGDRDSLGLFQQRPSTGWGSAEQIRDRERSIRAFYGGASDPNGTATRGLLDIPGWESMSFAAAAQTVQISAHPDRYSRWEKPAYEWLAALG